MIYSGSGLHFTATASISLRVCLCISLFFHHVACRNLADLIIKVPSQSLAGKENVVSYILIFIRIIHRKVQMCVMLDVAQRRATMLESVADCCFPSFGSVNLWVMSFWVYVYRRLKGLFGFPLIALWLVSLKTCLKHDYLWPDAFFFCFFVFFLPRIIESCQLHRPQSFKCTQ